MTTTSGNLLQDQCGEIVLSLRPRLQDRAKLVTLIQRCAARMEGAMTRKAEQEARMEFARLSFVMLSMGFFSGWSMTEGANFMIDELRENPSVLPEDVGVDPAFVPGKTLAKPLKKATAWEDGKTSAEQADDVERDPVTGEPVVDEAALQGDQKPTEASSASDPGQKPKTAPKSS